MKKAALVIIILIATAIIFISSSFSIKTVKAINNGNYSIARLDHTLEVMYNGYIFMNDTIQIVGNSSKGAALDSFLIGFPYKYRQHVLRCMALSASGTTLNVTLGVPLENRMGFYAVEIGFPQPLDISNGTVHVFTVGFLLSNNLLSASDTNLYILDFPAYPALTKITANCSAALVLPTNATNVVVTKDDGIENQSTYTKANLPNFSYAPANVTFSLPSNTMQLFDMMELKREITINGIGEMEGSDDYYITSKEPKEITAVEVILPPNASFVKVHDQFGRKFESDPTPVEDRNLTCYTVTFALPLESYKSTRFTVRYSLPRQVYVGMQTSTNNFNITFPLFQQTNNYIKSASLAIVFPEGARILNTENILTIATSSVARGVFQETVTVNREDISRLSELTPSANLQIVYEYNPLWASFRPTLWMLAFAVVGCVVAIIWKRPGVPVEVVIPTVAVKLQSEGIKSFVDSYEEKRKIFLEMDSLETMVRKGKIPRRRYKVRRKTLEMRLDALSRGLEGYREKMVGAGGKYADLMRQLEIAETEINEVEANIKSIETRHSRGELSLEAYRKLLSDYQHRKETTNTTISGILLRLREELH